VVKGQDIREGVAYAEGLLHLWVIGLEILYIEIGLEIFHPIISKSFPVRYYGISGTNLPDIL